MRGTEVYGKLLKGIFLSLFLSACALQSSMVDVEDSSTRLRKHQIQLQRRIEGLERNLDSSSQVKTQRSLSADLIAHQGATDLEVRKLSGQFSEVEHKMSNLENQVDAESFRTKDLVRRLNDLEVRIAALGGGGGRGNKEAQRSPRHRRKKQFFAPRDAFNLAYNDYVKGDYSVAILAFDAFIQAYPDSRLAPQAYYWKGESYYGKADYALAVDVFSKVVKDYPRSEKVSKSLLKTGFSFIELRKPDQGRRFLEKVITQFPSSNEAALARDTLLSLRNPVR